jgi:hypothetical protein
MLLISTYFMLAKKAYFPRDLWLKVNSTITGFISLLEKKVIDKKDQPQSTEDGGNIDQFLQSND